MLNAPAFSLRTASCNRTGPNAWMVVHGSGAGHETLASAVVGRTAALLVDDDSFTICRCKGPVAADFSPSMCLKSAPEILPHMRRRSSAARGLICARAIPASGAYEIFCKAKMRVPSSGKPCRRGQELGNHSGVFATLDSCEWKVSSSSIRTTCRRCIPTRRILGRYLWELGLDFTVSRARQLSEAPEQHWPVEGQGALQDLRASSQCDIAADMGDSVYADGKKSGNRDLWHVLYAH